MSSEVVKKKGRPKKVAPEPASSGLTETPKKTTTRQKSTKAVASKTTKATAAAALKTPLANATSTKSAADSAQAQKIPIKTPPPTPFPSKFVGQQKNAEAAKKTTASTVRPETSPILSKVLELPTKSIPTQAAAPKTASPSPASITSKPSASSSTTKTTQISPLKNSSNSIRPIQAVPPFKQPNVIKPSQPQTSPSATPTPKTNVPISTSNSTIVSNISTRAGARQNQTGPEKPLPPNYKPVARKVTMLIVALPVALVTSWVLFNRLVMGEERKLLVKPGLAKVDSPGSGVTKADAASPPPQSR